MKREYNMNDIGTNVIETSRLILRRFKQEDAYDVYKGWSSDIRLSNYVSWNIHTSIVEAEELVSRRIEEYDRNAYNWVVELRNSRELIGNISTVAIRRTHNNCEIGYCYGSQYWNKGYATEALKAVIKYLFEKCDMHIIEAKYHSTNPASGKVLKKAGMTKEAILRERRYCCATDTYADLIYYSISKDEYNKKITQEYDYVY